MDRDALLAEVEDLRRFLEAGDQIAWTADPEGGLRWASKRWLQLTGTESEGIGGEAWGRLLHPEDMERTAERWIASVASGDPYDTEHRVRMASGEFRWMRSRATAKRGADGAIREWFGWTEDIHERRMAASDAEAIAAAYRDLVETSPFGTYMVDEDLRILFVSAGARPAFPPVDRLVGVPLADIYALAWPPDVTERLLNEYRQVLATGEPCGKTIFAPRQDRGVAESYDYLLVRITLSDGRFGVVSHFRDITQERMTQADLEAAVEERTQELVRANRDLQEFSYSVAHDLRAPLRAIVSTARMLQEDAGTRLSSDEQALLERQMTVALRLSRLVDDLLSFAKLARAELAPTRFDLTALACEVSSEVAARYPDRPPIAIESGLIVKGDPGLVRQVLENLFDNALKFSPEGGPVSFGREGSEFAVRDSGVGFDPRHADKLFVAFERLVDAEEFEGTGVGLANVKRIVERHGGRVRAESPPGQGTAFFFTLPPAGPTPAKR